MTSADQDKPELIDRINLFLSWVVSMIMDGLFLSIWAILQWFMREVIIENFPISDSDQWIFQAFQYLFAFSTLVPVVIYIISDIIKMLKEAWGTFKD